MQSILNCTKFDVGVVQGKTALQYRRLSLLDGSKGIDRLEAYPTTVAINWTTVCKNRAAGAPSMTR